ncbi:MAG: SURF1 family protein [Actinobacteria bacterium]|nr:SURF1 family protein [Actinomycetota bacterium]
MSRSNLNKLFTIVGMLLVATIFIGLGLWQWNRAQENRKPVIVDQSIVRLDAIAKVGETLTSDSLLRNVVVNGRYIAVFKAPNQVDNQGQRGDWEAALLQTSGGGAILVVRGLWSDRQSSPALALGRVEVKGRLLPHQNDNYADSGANSLQRIDSSVIVDKTDAELFDGYIVSASEKTGGVLVSHDRIAAPKPRSAVPGFYWQHISYVIIWWFMAAIVLYLPFYQRRVAPEKTEILAQEVESQ